MIHKRLSMVVVLFLFLSFFQINAVAAESAGSVYVNNQKLSQDLIWTDSGGTVYVAAAEYSESLGGTFAFRADQLIGTIAVGGQELVYHLDGTTAVFNGKNITAASPMKIVNNRFMIPAVLTADKLGAVSYKDPWRSALMVFNPGDGKVVYSVLSGDTLWKISKVFSTSIDAIRQNNSINGDMLYVGQKLLIRQLAPYSPSISAGIISGATVFTGPGFNQPVKGYLSAGTSITIRGKTGDWYKVDSKLGTGNYVYRTVVGITQEVALSAGSTYLRGEIPVDTSRDTVTFNDYTVVKGDSIWYISQKFGISDYELAAANNVSAITVLYPGQVIRIPVHTIAPTAGLDPKYGEVLDWFKQAQYLFPQGRTGRVVDPVSGKSFLVKRTMGSSHSDTEPLTDADTQVMKQLFGGSWSWARKPFLLEVDGRRFAVSAAGMPHAGVDGAALYRNVDGRSGNYGYGPNYDAIPGNGMNGHFDLYFLNGRTHFDNSIDPEHQYNVMAAGGLR